MYNLYHSFTRVPFLKKSYALKFSFIAFLGIHLPLILFSALFLTNVAKHSTTTIFFALLFATLVATMATLIIQNYLLQPVRQAYAMLNNYLVSKQLPEKLPESHDEVGKLIQHIHSSIHTLDKLLREKDEVGVLLSHDLRMPLSQITMLAQSIRKENMPPETAKYIKMINSVAEEQLEFIGEMLMLFKSDTGISAEASFRPVELFGLVENILRETRVAAFQKGLNVFNNVQEHVYVRAQKDLLKHAILNLVSNAIKFSHREGCIYIDISIHDTFVHINVKDEGVGFTGDEYVKLFSLKPVRKEGTLGEKSNGVGLYFVKKIAEKHMGDVVAFSDGINQGATFTLLLPVKAIA